MSRLVSAKRRGRTLSLIVGLMMLLGPNVLAQPVISFQPDSSDVAPLDTVDIDIVIDASATGVHCYDVTFTFNHNYLQLIDIYEGSMFPNTGGQSFFFWEDQGGSYEIGNCLLGFGTFADGPGVLATIRLTSIDGLGLSDLVLLSVGIDDTLLAPMPVTSDNGRLVIQYAEPSFECTPNVLWPCGVQDTMWIKTAPNVIDIKGAFFRIGYESDNLQILGVFKGPTLTPPGDYFLHAAINEDSINISLADLQGTYTGPGYIIGIVYVTDLVSAPGCAVSPFRFDSSVVRDADNHTIPHHTRNASVAIDCCPPAVDVRWPEPGDTNIFPPACSLRVHDNGAGLVKASYQLDGCDGAWIDFWSHDLTSAETSFVWTPPATSSGDHDVYFRVFDNVGNYNEDTCNAAFYYTIGWTGNCCAGMRGNLDNSPDDTPTLGDLTVMIDHLFITLNPLTCWEEGNLDGSEPEGPGSVTLGDLTMLIDNLFISLDPLPMCP